MFEDLEVPFLKEVLVFLLATVVVVPLFHRMKASPVLGYLAAGALIGPFGLGVVENVHAVESLAELGIVFLLFMVGLELSWNRLWQMRRHVFGLGTSQVLICGLVIGVIAWFWGNGVEVSMLLGACLALSSTAIVVQLLVERGEFSSPLGRLNFSVLLFQDLAVVPMLILVGVLGAQTEGGILFPIVKALGQAILAVGVILLVGRLVLRPIFSVMANTRTPEIFIAMTLLAVLGMAALTGASGLSLALGAFLAGILIAETEFRHQIEIDMQPFKGLLLGLFFMSVGMKIDFGFVADRAFWVFASVLGLITIKSAITGLLCLGFGASRRIALQAAMLLGPSGEFAFVVIGAALTLKLLPAADGQFMLIVAGLSMLMTPILALVGRNLAGRMRAPSIAAGASDESELSEEIQGHVIIAGFGRVGRTVAKILDRQKIPYQAVDNNYTRVATNRKEGIPIFFGDASRATIMTKLGADRATAIVVTLDGPEAAGRLIEDIRRKWGHVPVFARTRDLDHSGQLREKGATTVIPETVESSLQLAGQVLTEYGAPRDAVDELVDQIREGGYRI